MEKIEPLKSGKFYHLYNRGINSESIFLDKDDYLHFLRLYEKYMSPIANTFAYVLMNNHFHLLVEIREKVVYRYSNDTRMFDPERFNDIKWETVDLVDNLTASACEAPDNSNARKFPKPHLHVSHLCNAYAKYFNKRHERHGALFERAFKRKMIENSEYLKSLVLYIHNNPVHHGFCEHPVEYPWSSYLACISVKPSKVQRNTVVGWFDNEANFKELHSGKTNFITIEDWLGI
jgi:putative transposase